MEKISNQISEIIIHDAGVQKDVYTIQYGNRYLNIGFMVKEIVESLKNGFGFDEISKEINTKHPTLGLTSDKIKELIEVNVIKKMEQKAKSSFFFKKKLFDPSSIVVIEPPKFLFNNLIFFGSIAALFCLNVLIFYKFYDISTNLTTKENVLLYLALLLILFLHEMGHVIAAKRYKINASEMGVGLYLILPVLYVNLNEIWKLDYWKRIKINLSGVAVQLVIGAILFSLYSFTKSNFLLSLFHLNFVIICLNLVPFSRLDGYWVISDLLGTGNLDRESAKTIMNIFKLNFKASEPKLMIYSVFKMGFLGYIFYKLSLGVLNFIFKIYLNQPLVWLDFMPLVILGLYIFFITKGIKTSKKAKLNQNSL
jgi:putative peptide zinc metalloprotease protein